MTIDIEEHLVAGMRDRTAGLAPTGDIYERAARRHRKRTALVRTAGAAGVAGLAATLAAVLAIGGGGSAPTAPDGRPPLAASPASPQLRLAAAVTASTNISYRFTSNHHLAQRPGAELDESERADLKQYGRPGVTSTGAFDPATTTGFLREDSPKGSELRLVNGDLYTGKGGSFHPERGKHTRLPFGAMGGALGASADPEQLLTALRDNGTVAEAAPNTYRFTVEQPAKATDGGGQAAASTLTGEIVVGGDGRIQRVRYEQSLKAEDGRPRGLLGVMTLEFSGYGAPVTVERPPTR